MTTELTTVDFNHLPSTQIGNDAVFNEMSKGGTFLKRLQLYSKGKAISKNLIGSGHWGIPESDKEITDLGTSVDVYVLARRPKAMDMSDTDAIISNYDVESDTFQNIMKRSEIQNSGCMFGPSFLVWERSSEQFLEFFCGTKSLRAEAKKLYPLLPVTEADIKARDLTNVEPHGPTPCTMGVDFIEKKSFSWHVPVVGKCSTPFENLPSNEVIAKEIEKFINPSEDSIEKVDDETTKRRAR